MTVAERSIPLSPARQPGPVAAEPRLRPWLALIQAHAAVTRELEAELQVSGGLSLAAYDALVQLALAEGKLRMSELADRVLLSRSGVSRLVDRLEADDLVAREACPSDARVMWATLTEKGRERLAASSPIHLRGVEEHFLEAIEPADRDALARALDAVIRRLRGDGTDLRCPALPEADGTASAGGPTDVSTGPGGTPDGPG